MDNSEAETSKDTISIEEKREKHRECCRRWRKNNPDRVRAYNKTYEESHKNRGNKSSGKERVRAWREKNKDKNNAYNKQYRETHAQQIAARVLEWQKLHPEHVRATRHRRRAREIGNGGSHTAEDIQRQGEAQRWKCWWCGKKCKKKNHVDHLIPLSRGGHNNPSNIVISCPRCNLQKHDKFPDEFIGRLF